jgi:GT2 family glycosyltransferase
MIVAVADPHSRRADVVIINYRSYDDLTRCLASLEADQESIASIVVVDHDSNLADADRIRARFPSTLLIPRTTNGGFAAGVNLGARQTSGSFLLLLNPDCHVVPGACARLIERLTTRTDAGVVGPRILNADGSVQASARRFPDLTTAIAGRSTWLTRVLPGNPLSRRNLPARDEHLSEPVDVDWVSGACMLVRRSAFDALQGMDERFFLYWEDADFCRRLKAAGWKTVYDPSIEIVHTGGQSSRHAARSSLEAFHRSAFRLYWKHAGLPGRLLAPVVFVGLEARLAVMKRWVRQSGG